jgi:hypothetical protein
VDDIFDRAQAGELVRRIEGLRPDAPRQWGKMDAAQMLRHCQVGLELALGDMTLKRAFLGLLFGRIAKRQLFAPKPFGRNLPTAPEFRVREPRDFAREQARLLALVRRLAQGGPAALTRAPHPFFGTLTSAEWSALQWKHLDHHLRQFGA